MSSSNKCVSRRSFLKTGAAVGVAAFAVPCLVPERAFGANEKIITGHIGVANRGMQNLHPLMAHAAAVCDVDRKHAAAAQKAVEKKNGKCQVFSDFRKLLDQKDIDAVVISTPDHWHALMVMMACQAGKDVYCEKPLTLFITEGRAMVRAARKYKRIVQTGSQQRSDDKFRTACEMVRSGRIGKLTEVKVGIPGCNHPGDPGPDGDPPEWLDYDMWLGPAPYRPYNAKRVHYNFRFWWDYSGGQMTNFGAHHLDIAQWGMGTDNSGPVEIEGKARYHEKKWFEVFAWCDITYKYASGVVVHCGQDYPGGTTFIGTEGQIFVTRGKLNDKATGPEPSPEKQVKLYRSKDHYANWLECIKTRKLPVADVEIGHRSATVCHLGNIAGRLGRNIRWDPAKEQIVGDAEAAKMITRPYRKPWKLPAV